MSYTLYKIYYDTELIYLGRTTMKLQDRLRGHFFKKPMMREIDINQVTKIEYAEFETEADMFVYEIFLINKLRPPLNKDDKANDDLTIELPEVEFKPYFCVLLKKWKHQIYLKDIEDKNKREEKNRLAEIFREQKKIKRATLPYEEYQDWLNHQETVVNCRLDKEGW